MFFILQVADVEMLLSHGEDQRSIEKNLAAIASECKKTQPDKAIIADKMKRTAAYRQKLCLEETTAVVLEKFPCYRQHLFVSSMLSSSFKKYLNFINI